MVSGTMDDVEQDRGVGISKEGTDERNKESQRNWLEFSKRAQVLTHGLPLVSSPCSEHSFGPRSTHFSDFGNWMGTAQAS